MITAELIERFEAKFQKTEGCWNWTASTAGKGYGQIKLPGTRRQIYAHRLSWLIYKGDVPDGHQVLHNCDNPKCVNPAHLFTGTGEDNLQDMKQKGRHLYGERNNQSKLTDDKVRQIKACLAAGMSQRRVAKAFDVIQSTISKIHRGRRWAHVTKL